MERQLLINRVLAGLKFILAILLLPVVFGLSLSLYKNVSALENSESYYFLWGIFSYLILHIFIYRPLQVYKRGQRLAELIFKFFTPLLKVAPYLVPVYAILLFAVYLLLIIFLEPADINNWFLFLFSFSICFHIVFTADNLKTKEHDLLRANYFFGLSLIYITNIIFLVALIRLLVPEFSFLKVISSTYDFASNIYISIFTQLFSSEKQPVVSLL